MSKGMRIAVLLVAAVCMFALFTTSAYGYSGFHMRCESCHAVRTGATVSFNAGTDNGTTTQYGVSITGATEFAAFAGYTKVASGSNGTTITVPNGVTYEVYAVGGTPTSGTYGKATVSPVFAWPADDNDTVAPTSSSNAAVSYTGSKATIEITAVDAADTAGGETVSMVEYIYWSLDGGAVRTTPVGSNGKAIAVIVQPTEGTVSHTIQFWAQDRAGNDETPQSASFTITRTGAGSAAAALPSVIGADGQSVWTYKDLADSTAKYEGGYAAFGQLSGNYSDPHGGYDTATNKCKVCHAVHRAEGAYYLLRADSQDDACDYCHIGGSAHSSKVVYDLNSAGKGTNNGHTIGASTYIPDSTIAQWTEEVVLETAGANGDVVSEIIEVRAYDTNKNDMYRFARHHGHSEATGSARRNYLPVGPLALRCMSCHQVHNAAASTWQSISMASMGDAGEYLAQTTSSYKLLKQSPSGTFSGTTDAYGQISIGNISIVPETTLTAGVNFDSARSMGTTPGALALVRGSSSRNYAKPLWVAQNFDGEHDRNEALAEEAIAASVNNAALSVWCADCHNLNIGGWEHLTSPELGFKAHTERTHPAPYTGAHSGPGQCYSCHRNDLPRINTGDSCSQCHYGTGNYKENRAGDELVQSDFPHSGEDNDYKMLGSYSITPITTYGGSGTTIDDNVVVGPTNLDAVCIRCHGGIGTYH